MSTSERHIDDNPDWTPADRSAREYQHHCYVLEAQDTKRFVDASAEGLTDAWVRAAKPDIRDLEAMR